MTGQYVPPATSRWREGDPPGRRRFARFGSLPLEFGATLPDYQLAYETWGTLSPARDNAILIEHAFTGDSHVSGAAGPGHPTPGWWDDVVGPGAAVDTDEWFVVCANVLGGCQGSTGPSSVAPDGQPWGSRWPRISIRDHVNAEVRLAEHLGIDRWASVIGGSMGGMRALEWLVGHPERVSSAVVVAAGAAATADQIATQTAQIQAIVSDPNWQAGDYYVTAAPASESDGVQEGPEAGLAIARRFAHLSYRSEEELEDRFGGARSHPTVDTGGAYHSAIPGRDPDATPHDVQSYLDHQVGKFTRRFDAGSYVTLSDSMSSFDVARGRGSLHEVLDRVSVPVGVAGITSDRLFPLRLQEELVAHIPTAQLSVIESAYGHDGFLVESEPVQDLITTVLRRAGGIRPGASGAGTEPVAAADAERSSRAVCV